MCLNVMRSAGTLIAKFAGLIFLRSLLVKHGYCRPGLSVGYAVLKGEVTKLTKVLGEEPLAREN